MFLGGHRGKKPLAWDWLKAALKVHYWVLQVMIVLIVSANSSINVCQPKENKVPFSITRGVV